jgi:hypothetical protein
LTAAVILAGVVISCVVSVRLVLVLPGTAVADRTTTLRRSWQLTRGNAWRLIEAFLLLSLTPVIAFAILAAAAWATGIPAAALNTGPIFWVSFGDKTGSSGAELTAGVAVVNLLSLVLNYWSAVLVATFLSLVYLRAAPTDTTPSSSPTR